MREMIEKIRSVLSIYLSGAVLGFMIGVGLGIGKYEIAVTLIGLLVLLFDMRNSEYRLKKSITNIMVELIEQEERRMK